MTKFSYLNRDNEVVTREFQKFHRDGKPHCAVSYVTDDAALKLMTHDQYDDVIGRFNRLSANAQSQYLKQIKWDHLSETEKAKQPNPMDVLSPNERQNFHHALENASITRADRHAAAVRDCCFKNGEGRNEAVYDVRGRPVIASLMTPAVISFNMGTHSLEEVRRVLKARSRKAEHGGGHGAARHPAANQM